MLNKERPEVIEFMVDYCSGDNDDNWDKRNDIGCSYCMGDEEFEEWANSEYKVFYLTEDELKILNELDDEIEGNFRPIICRDKDSGNLNIADKYGICLKEGDCVEDYPKCYNVKKYNHLFPWIKKGESYDIWLVEDNSRIFADDYSRDLAQKRVDRLESFQNKADNIRKNLKFSLIYSNDDYILEKGFFHEKDKKSCKKLIKFLRKEADALEKELQTGSRTTPEE